MDESDYELSSKKNEFLDKDSNNKSSLEKEEFKDKKEEDFHLNYLITKNISLFTKDPNYKLLAWLIVQLIIFSLFILAVGIMKNNVAPYLNSI